MFGGKNIVFPIIFAGEKVHRLRIKNIKNFNTNNIKDFNIQPISRPNQFQFKIDRSSFVAFPSLFSRSKIDRSEQGLVTQEQFRAAIESRFELGMTDEEYGQFLKNVPIDRDGMVQYVEFMSRFDTK